MTTASFSGGWGEQHTPFTLLCCHLPPPLLTRSFNETNPFFFPHYIRVYCSYEHVFHHCSLVPSFRIIVSFSNQLKAWVGWQAIVNIHVCCDSLAHCTWLLFLLCTQLKKNCQEWCKNGSKKGERDVFTQGTGQKYQPSARRQGENNICFPVSILVVCKRTQEGVLVHSGDKCYIHARIHTRIHTHSHIHIRTIHASIQLSFCFFYNLPVHPSWGSVLFSLRPCASSCLCLFPSFFGSSSDLWLAWKKRMRVV